MFNISIEEGIYNLQILDITGKIVLTDRIQGNQKQVSLDNLESGTYFIRIYNDGVDLNERIVLEK